MSTNSKTLRLRRVLRHTSRYGTPSEHAKARIALALDAGKGVTLSSLEVKALWGEADFTEFVEEMLDQAESFGR